MEGPWHSEEVKVEATETDGPHRGPPRATTSTSTIEVEGVAEDLVSQRLKLPGLHGHG